MLNDSGYDKNKTQFLVDGFRQGFRIDCNISPTYRLSGNLQSAKQHPEIVSQKLIKVIEANRIASPFSCPPFPNFVCSPLGVCPKKKPGTFYQKVDQLMMAFLIMLLRFSIPDFHMPFLRLKSLVVVFFGQVGHRICISSVADSSRRSSLVRNVMKK